MSRQETTVAGALRRIVLGRGLVLIVMASLVGGFAGYGAAVFRGEGAVAQATVLVTPLEGNPFSPSGSGEDLTNLFTEAELVSSDAVARLVAARIGNGVTEEELLAGLSVSVPTNTQIIEIEYQAGAAETAVARAQAFAEAFLDQRRIRTESRIADQTEKLQGQIEGRLQDLEGLLSDLQETRDPSAERALLQAQIDSVSTQIGQLRSTLTELSTGSTDPGQIVTPAAVPPAGILNTRALSVVGGMLLGALAAAGLIMLRTRRTGRVHDREDVEAAGLNLLGEVARAELVTPDENPSDVAPIGYRDLRLELLTRFRECPLTILIASADSGQQVAASGYGLAAAVAFARRKTILIDTTGTVGVGTLPGLNEVILAEAGLHEALVDVHEYLSILPTGGSVLDPDDLYLSPAMSTVLSEARTHAGVVIVLTGTIEDSRVRVLAGMADTILIEATEGVTRAGALTRLSAEELAPASLGGVILVTGSRKAARISKSRGGKA